MGMLDLVLPQTLRNQDSDFGLVIDWDFHKAGKWVCALTPYLVAALIREFSPVLIRSQAEYDRKKGQLKRLVSMEPGWAAPRLKYDTGQDCVKAAFYSDPQYDTIRRWAYLDDNGFDFVLSYYLNPFFRHFSGFPESRFVHVPWAIPDQFVGDGTIVFRNDEVAIFGGRQAPSYNIRNWCREQEGVVDYANSGVENKTMTDREFMRWLGTFDAIIAAGSDDPAFDMVTPKYFEAASAGCLLFGQECTDLGLLGFNDTNAVIFSKEDFVEKLKAYRSEPQAYLDIRKNGRDLIRERHTVSRRIKEIRRALYG